MEITISELEEVTFYEDDTNEIPPTDIIAYNEARSCADLYRMYSEGVLEIKPDFQREVVWKTPAQTRFIDSLVKQLPIPSMCFSLDYRSQKWQVIDGLQRMATIVKFLEKKPWTLSKLADVDPKLSGKSINEISDTDEDLSDIYKRVKNLSLPITVIRCDYSKKTHKEYLFTIFHRLNSGGTKLNNQEIRNCIYSGKFNEFLREMNKYPDWIALAKVKIDGDRFLKQELILRMFALRESHQIYTGRLATFLNDYMEKYRNPSSELLKINADIFYRTTTFLYKRLFNSKTPDITITLLEAILVGSSICIDKLEQMTDEQINTRYQKLIENPEFSEIKLREGLSGKSRVIGRISAAIEIFA